jgi:hypothetical protein
VGEVLDDAGSLHLSAFVPASQIVQLGNFDISGVELFLEGFQNVVDFQSLLIGLR